MLKRSNELIPRVFNHNIFKGLYLTDTRARNLINGLKYADLPRFY